MNNKTTEDRSKAGELFEPDPLMEAYNPLPAQAEQPTRFYWQELWLEVSTDRAIQAAFEV